MRWEPAHTGPTWVRICVANSRADDSTMALIGSAPHSDLRAAALLLSRRCTVGMRNAMVLPVPVLALARQSFPSRRCGSVSAWTGVSAVIPAAASAPVNSAQTPGAAMQAPSPAAAGDLPAGGAPRDTSTSTSASIAMTRVRRAARILKDLRGRGCELWRCAGRRRQMSGRAREYWRPAVFASCLGMMRFRFKV